MAEYISREEAIKELREVYENEYPTASGDFDEYASHDVPNVLRNMKAADVQPVKKTEFQIGYEQGFKAVQEWTVSRMKLIDGDKLERHLDYLIQKEEQLAKECPLSPNNEFERQRRYCFEANALAYGLCKNVMDYYIVADAQVMNQWISVKDRLPDDGEMVLIYAPRTQNQYYVAMFYTLHDEIKFAMNVYGVSYCWYAEEVTYWQPLSKPPQDEISLL